MKVMWTPEQMKGVDREKRGRWGSYVLRCCECCGLEWEAFRENESCPMAELEAELFPNVMESECSLSVGDGNKLLSY